MKTLNHKLRRDLFSSKGMLLAIIAIIAVGGGCLVGMLSTFLNLKNAEISYYSQCRMADFWMDLKKAPLPAVKELTDTTGVSDLRTRIVFPVIVDLEGVSEPISGKVLSLPDIRTPVINDIIIRSGGYFTDKRRDEVIVSEKFAKARDLTPGSFLHLVMNGQRKKLFVIGTGISSEFMYLTPPGSFAPDPKGYGAFWIKRSFAEDVFGFHGACNNIVGRLTPEARQTPTLVLDEFERALAPFGVFTKTPLKEQFSNLTLSAEMQGLQQEATLFPIIFLGVAALVLNVVMTRMTEKERVIIGTLKALGVSNRTIFLHYIFFGLAVGAAGGVAGCLMGWWISSEMTTLYQGLFTFPKLENHIYPSVMIAALLVSIVFSALGALRGVRKVIGLSPAESMRPSPPPIMGRTLIENWTWLWNRLDFRWQMVLRALFRNKGRTVIGLTAAALGASMIILALGMYNSITYMVSFQFQKVMLSNYNINLRDAVDGGALNEIRDIDGVTHVEPMFEVACDFINGNHRKKGVITGIIKGAKLTIPCDVAGAPVKVPETGLLLTKRLAKQLHVEVGDSITFVPIKGLRKPFKTTVTGVVGSTFGIAVYADYNFLNHLVGEENAISSLQLNARFNQTQLDAFHKKAKAFPKLSFLCGVDKLKDQINREFTAKLASMTYVMVGFAAIIFFGSILNSALISLAEKQREIATFRVLGYQSTEVGSIFLREIMLVNMIGAVVGLPLGYFLLYGMCLGFQNNLYAMPCMVKTPTWIISYILAFVFTFSAFLIIQRAINKMNWSDALKMRE